MIHCDDRDLQIVPVEKHLRMAGTGRGRDHFGHSAETGRIGNLWAVMCRAICAVEPIGHIETRHDIANALGPCDRQRRGTRTAHPCLQHQLAQSVYVIGMQVREVDFLEPSNREAHPRKPARAARTNVEHHCMAAGDHTDTGSRTCGIGHG